jgi:type 1 glutamine amidotransferase
MTLKSPMKLPILLAFLAACGADLMATKPDAGGPPATDDGDTGDGDGDGDGPHESMDGGSMMSADAGVDAATGKDAGEGLPTHEHINVLVIAEHDTNHGPFVEAALPWLESIPELNVTHVEDPNSISDEMLDGFGLILQLNYPPFAWDEGPKAAFQRYIEEEKGGWVGLHHASLYGSLVTNETWPWFYDFIGQVSFKGYIATFAAADVHVEAIAHPIFTGVPATFNVMTDEWYTWDGNPRDHATVLANVDEDSYVPDSDVKMGDHPVVWTNPSYAARNLYIFMGHHPNLMQNEAYKTLLHNAIFWAGKEAN